jgi:hypothetical protein
VQTRRRLPRQSADWAGQYEFEDDPTVGAGSCRIVDFSTLGAGIELFGDTPIDPVGRRVTVDISRRPGGSIGLRLAGEVRNITLGASGGVRVGVEFAGLDTRGRPSRRAHRRSQMLW